MKRISVLCLLVLFAFAGPIACDENGDDAEPEGDDESAAAGDFDDGTAMSALSAGDAQELCDEMTAEFEELFDNDEFLQGICLMGVSVGLGEMEMEGADLVTMCEEGMEECLVEMENETFIDDEDEECWSLEELEGCEATVADARTCTQALMDNFFGGIIEIGENSCGDIESLDSDELEEVMMGMMALEVEGLPEIDECAPLQECPNLDILDI